MGKKWGNYGVTNEQGRRLLLSTMPRDLPHGAFSLHDYDPLTDEQQRIENAFHELGHAVAYLHAGCLTAVSMMPRSDAAAQVHCWNSGQNLSSDDIRIGLTAGYVAGIEWVHQEGLWSPAAQYVRESRAQNDRWELHDRWDVSFGQDGPHDYDALCAKALGLLRPYWNRIADAVPELMKATWWGWDETAERLGFSHLVDQVVRDTSEAVRRSLGREDGTYTYDFDQNRVAVSMEGGTWVKTSTEQIA